MLHTIWSLPQDNTQPVPRWFSHWLVDRGDWFEQVPLDSFKQISHTMFWLSEISTKIPMQKYIWHWILGPQYQSNFCGLVLKVLTISISEGSWYWPNSLELMDYSAWADGEPNNNLDGKLESANCAQIFGYDAKPGFKFSWNDFPCSYSRSHWPYPEGPLFSICQRAH